ncbi:MAG: IS200/IS605 family transposase [Bacillota bacterium]|nr:IS200/IS605 family transposase [Bacillota bacterium]
MQTVHHGRGYVYSIKYHLVWCVKYRKDILKDDVDTQLKTILQKSASNQGFSIEEIESDSDHIHLLIECTPQHYIPSLVKGLKGVSARLLFKSFPELKSQLWGGHLWNPSYFVATVSENTEEQIKDYIQSQKKVK